MSTTEYVWSSHDMARKLLELPDLDLWIETNDAMGPYERAVHAPEERVVSYLYNDETDHVIVMKSVEW